MTEPDLHATALFNGTTTPGVYRLVAAPADIAASLSGAGWARVGRVERVTSKAEFLAAVGDALHFPDYYGQNLDALWDCLSELAQPTALVWAQWHELAVGSPQEWAQLIMMLDERTRVDPAFALVLA